MAAIRNGLKTIHMDPKCILLCKESCSALLKEYHRDCNYLTTKTSDGNHETTDMPIISLTLEQLSKMKYMGAIKSNQESTKQEECQDGYVLLTIKKTAGRLGRVLYTSTKCENMLSNHLINTMKRAQLHLYNNMKYFKNFSRIAIIENTPYTFEQECMSRVKLFHPLGKSNYISKKSRMILKRKHLLINKMNSLQEKIKYMKENIFNNRQSMFLEFSSGKGNSDKYDVGSLLKLMNLNMVMLCNNSKRTNIGCGMQMRSYHMIKDHFVGEEIKETTPNEGNDNEISRDCMNDWENKERCVFDINENECSKNDVKCETQSKSEEISCSKPEDCTFANFKLEDCIFDDSLCISASELEELKRHQSEVLINDILDIIAENNFYKDSSLISANCSSSSSTFLIGKNLHSKHSSNVNMLSPNISACKLNSFKADCKEYSTVNLKGSKSEIDRSGSNNALHSMIMEINNFSTDKPMGKVHKAKSCDQITSDSVGNINENVRRLMLNDYLDNNIKECMNNNHVDMNKLKVQTYKHKNINKDNVQLEKDNTFDQIGDGNEFINIKNKTEKDKCSTEKHTSLLPVDVKLTNDKNLNVTNTLKKHDIKPSRIPHRVKPLQTKTLTETKPITQQKSETDYVTHLQISNDSFKKFLNVFEQSEREIKDVDSKEKEERYAIHPQKIKLLNVPSISTHSEISDKSGTTSSVKTDRAKKNFIDDIFKKEAACNKSMKTAGQESVLLQRNNGLLVKNHTIVNDGHSKNDRLPNIMKLNNFNRIEETIQSLKPKNDVIGHDWKTQPLVTITHTAHVKLQKLTKKLNQNDATRTDVTNLLEQEPKRNHIYRKSMLSTINNWSGARKSYTENDTSSNVKLGAHNKFIIENPERNLKTMPQEVNLGLIQSSLRNKNHEIKDMGGKINTNEVGTLLKTETRQNQINDKTQLKSIVNYLQSVEKSKSGKRNEFKQSEKVSVKPTRNEFVNNIESITIDMLSMDTVLDVVYPKNHVNAIQNKPLDKSNPIREANKFKDNTLDKNSHMNNITNRSMKNYHTSTSEEEDFNSIHKLGEQDVSGNNLNLFKMFDNSTKMKELYASKSNINYKGANKSENFKEYLNNETDNTPYQEITKAVDVKNKINPMKHPVTDIKPNNYPTSSYKNFYDASKSSSKNTFDLIDSLNQTNVNILNVKKMITDLHGDSAKVGYVYKEKAKSDQPEKAKSKTDQETHHYQKPQRNFEKESTTLKVQNRQNPYKYYELEKSSDDLESNKRKVMELKQQIEDHKLRLRNTEYSTETIEKDKLHYDFSIKIEPNDRFKESSKQLQKSQFSGNLKKLTDTGLDKKIQMKLFNRFHDRVKEANTHWFENQNSLSPNDIGKQSDKTYNKAWTRQERNDIATADSKYESEPQTTNKSLHPTITSGNSISGVDSIRPGRGLNSIGSGFTKNIREDLVQRDAGKAAFHNQIGWSLRHMSSQAEKTHNDKRTTPDDLVNHQRNVSSHPQTTMVSHLSEKTIPKANTIERINCNLEKCDIPLNYVKSESCISLNRTENTNRNDTNEDMPKRETKKTLMELFIYYKNRAYEFLNYKMNYQNTFLIGSGDSEVVDSVKNTTKGTLKTDIDREDRFLRKKKANKTQTEHIIMKTQVPGNKFLPQNTERYSKDSSTHGPNETIAKNSSELLRTTSNVWVDDLIKTNLSANNLTFGKPNPRVQYQRGLHTSEANGQNVFHNSILFKNDKKEISYREINIGFKKTSGDSEKTLNSKQLRSQNVEYFLKNRLVVGFNSKDTNRTNSIIPSGNNKIYNKPILNDNNLVVDENKFKGAFRSFNANSTNNPDWVLKERYYANMKSKYGEPNQFNAMIGSLHNNKLVSNDSATSNVATNDQHKSMPIVGEESSKDHKLVDNLQKQRFQANEILNTETVLQNVNIDDPQKGSEFGKKSENVEQNNVDLLTQHSPETYSKNQQADVGNAQTKTQGTTEQSEVCKIDSQR